MAATKQDRSGVFDAELRPSRVQRAAAVSGGFQLSPKGITFTSEQSLPEWTEVGVEMRLPGTGAHKGQQIDCRGVVVKCARRPQGKGFEMALLFLDLPARVQARLSTNPVPFSPGRISISR